MSCRIRLLAAITLAACAAMWPTAVLASGSSRLLDRMLTLALQAAGFTGRIEEQLEARLGREVDLELAELGRLLFFDPIGALHEDNACAGCHAPSAGMGDTQSMAIGIQSNRVVGPSRMGPRNQRRTPTVINNAFYPKLMWNGRFFAPSGDPFDGSLGFRFPLPEGATRFPENDPVVTHLLIAQAHIPPTELVEVAGFTGTFGQLEPRFAQFDDGLGGIVPPPDASGFRNEPIRQALLARLNASSEYRRLFGERFPSVAAGGPIDFTMFGRAIAEFEFTLVRANAPLDRYARGDRSAMTRAEKRGALVFFGTGGCVRCHAVAGEANEMFSDFRMHVAAVPQLAPLFGLGTGNVIFDGPGEDEDFGLEQITLDPRDRYMFRTSPLRNLAVQSAFFHNGAFTRLEDALRYHLDTPAAATTYDPQAAGVARDLQFRPGPISPPLARIDPLLATPVRLSDAEFRDLVEFLRFGLLDEGVLASELCLLVPPVLPSGMRPLDFEGCATSATQTASRAAK